MRVLVEPRVSAIRLAVFALLAGVVAERWVTMLATPPLLRAIAAIAVISLAAGLLALIDHSRLRGARRYLAATAALLTATALALVLVGLPPRLLLPSGWSELGAGLDVGIAGVAGINEYPYDGSNEWARLTLLLGLPLLPALAAGWSFWPRRLPAADPRLAGLGLLLAAYAIAITAYDRAAALGPGLLLAALVIAWIWLPGAAASGPRDPARPARRLLPAAMMLALALAVAIPFTLRYENANSLVDYSAWSWSGGGGTSFDWDHSYGPIDWERDDRTVFEVKADRPAYWKASVLDRFDGRGWTQSAVSALPVELPAQVEGTAVDGRLDPRWSSTYEFTIGDLSSEQVIGPGIGRQVLSGIETSLGPDRSELLADPALEKGDAYRLGAYTPDPKPARMRAAGSQAPLGLRRYLTLELPLRGSNVTMTTTVPDFLGREYSTGAARIADTVYAPTYRLARRLAADAPSSYDAVKAIETHLRSTYTYDERPPERDLPLQSFLFEDEIGYCQQFSGAMALMLRMDGIPARVVGGFAPGVPNASAGTYRVRDLDAHSWVEVYFNGIGWVPFDPTPGEAPAAGQAIDDAAASAGSSGISGSVNLDSLLNGSGEPSGADRGGGGARADDNANKEKAGGGDGGAGEGGGLTSPLPLGLLGLLAIGGAGGIAVLILRARRDGRRSPRVSTRIRVAELQDAIVTLGWQRDESGGALTLLGLEQRLRRRGADGKAAAYVARLREASYAPSRDQQGHSAPTDRASAAGRRALRRQLIESGGWRARLRAYRLIPPLSPRG